MKRKETKTPENSQHLQNASEHSHPEDLSKSRSEHFETLPNLVESAETSDGKKAVEEALEAESDLEQGSTTLSAEASLNIDEECPEVCPVLLGRKINVGPNAGAQNLNLISIKGLANTVIHNIRKHPAKLHEAKKKTETDSTSEIEFEAVGSRHSFTNLFEPDLTKIFSPSTLEVENVEELLETAFEMGNENFEMGNYPEEQKDSGIKLPKEFEEISIDAKKEIGKKHKKSHAAKKIEEIAVAEPSTPFKLDGVPTTSAEETDFEEEIELACTIIRAQPPPSDENTSEEEDDDDDDKEELKENI